MIIDGFIPLIGKFKESEYVNDYIKSNQFDKVVLTPNYKLGSEKGSYKKWSNRNQKKDINLKVCSRISLAKNLRNNKQIVKRANENLLAIAQNCSNHAFAFYGVYSNKYNLVEKIDHAYNKNSFNGLHIDQCVFDVDLIDERLMKLYWWAGNKKLPVMIRPSSKMEVSTCKKLSAMHRKRSLFFNISPGSKQ